MVLLQLRLSQALWAPPSHFQLASTADGVSPYYYYYSTAKQLSPRSLSPPQ
jgi:hypothetical protein